MFFKNAKVIEHKGRLWEVLLEEANETWQLNAVPNPRLDSLPEGKKCYETSLDSLTHGLDKLLC